MEKFKKNFKAFVFMEKLPFINPGIQQIQILFDLIFILNYTNKKQGKKGKRNKLIIISMLFPSIWCVTTILPFCYIANKKIL